MRFAYVAVSIATISLAGCAAVPSVPPDTDFPASELLRFTACELRDAYRELHTNKYPDFKAKEYVITVQLQPKADIEGTLKAGLTGKSSTTNTFFNSWAVGAATGAGAPGAGVDTTGHQDGAVYFTIKSATLLTKNKKRPLDCEHWSEAQHALATNLQVRDWLIRTATSPRPIGEFAVDKHSFLAEVTIQWDVAGAFTYNFPLGTRFGTGSVRYKVDEILSVTITHEEPKQKFDNIATLPQGDDKGFGVQKSSVGVRSNAISPESQTRQDLLQLQQSIQNLQVTPR